MHLEITGDESISTQTRTYAEYRLFAALSQTTDTARVRSASLRVMRARRGRRGAVCSVTVTLDGGETARLEASGHHPCAAINRAVHRLAGHAALVRGGPQLARASGKP